jgi:hypothetical protein
MEKKYEGKRPPDISFHAAKIPNPWAKMRFRARRSATGNFILRPGVA